MSFQKEKIIYITDYKEFNYHLNMCKRKYKTTKDTFKDQLKALKQEDLSVTGYDLYILSYKITNVELEYCPFNFNTHKHDKLTKFIFKLDGSTVSEEVSPMTSFALLQKMSNKGIIDLRDNERLYDKTLQKWNIAPAVGIRYINHKYIDTRTPNCIGYDVNSSFPWAMTQPIPDTTVKPHSGFVKQGEIGFNEEVNNYDDEIRLHAHFGDNTYCEWIFPEIESPLIHFAEFYYKRKQDTKDKHERQKYKNYLNFSIGYIRRYNPFIHACIIERSNLKIWSKIDENTIKVNVDSIVSSKPRTDLTISNKLGDFKIEHQGNFAMNKSGYQWNETDIHVSGKSKQWFENEFNGDFDLLEDKLPTAETANVYRFNEQTMQIEIIER